MTVYAYRNGILAADSQMTIGGATSGETLKIAKKGPFLCAANGNCAIAGRFRDWFVGGMKGEAPSMVYGDDDYAAFGHIFCPDGWIIRFEPTGAHRFKAEYVSDGSGSHIALGAMAAGASAKKAVAAAIKHDIYCGGEIKILRHTK